MYRLLPLRPLGGSDAVVLPKRAVQSLGWDRLRVPLRPVMRGGRLVLEPDPLLRDLAVALGPLQGGIRRAVVYGSYVGGRNWKRGESDVDLLVIGEPRVERPVMEGANRVFLKHLVPISVMFYTPGEARRLEGGRYLREVFRTGVELWGT